MPTPLNYSNAVHWCADLSCEWRGADRYLRTSDQRLAAAGLAFMPGPIPTPDKRLADSLYENRLADRGLDPAGNRA